MYTAYLFLLWWLWKYVYLLSDYYHHQIGSVIYLTLFKVRSWNNALYVFLYSIFLCSRFYLQLCRICKADIWRWGFLYACLQKPLTLLAAISPWQTYLFSLGNQYQINQIRCYLGRHGLSLPKTNTAWLVELGDIYLWQISYRIVMTDLQNWPKHCESKTRAIAHQRVRICKNQP